ncbi:hypothetical protein PoB_000798300 [Plakobranchus ocellatus]|uniref:Uncharacterized protein n=1 Tax=Plakobranchus ocellatus TaxID=259542 RepID=A0AAV3YGF3_9GAST|nr:hypothetical protein PoB_000798300 [Plakobranchus ocellatus]
MGYQPPLCVKKPNGKTQKVINRTDSNGSSNNMWIWIGLVIAAVIVIAVIAIVVVKRRRIMSRSPGQGEGLLDDRDAMVLEYK